MQAITIDQVLSAFTAGAGEPDGNVPEAELPEATFGDLGYDSLALIAAITDLEQQFGVQIPDGDMLGLRTLGDLVELVNESRLAVAAESTS
jgi:acyl carrier protein